MGLADDGSLLDVAVLAGEAGLNPGTLFTFACGSDPVDPVGAVQAGIEAQQHGFGSYRIDGREVALLGKDGSAVGTLRLTVPDADSRLVRIDYVDQRWAEVEAVRPVDGKFLRTPVAADREGVLVSDPALAPFFAAVALGFEVVSPQAS